MATTVAVALTLRRTGVHAKARISFVTPTSYCPAETLLIGPVGTYLNINAETENFASVPPSASFTTR